MNNHRVHISIFELFIVGTGIAAFLHSTWAIATYFAGPEPLQGSLQWLLWIIEGGLVAFAMDVGQIATSVLIRSGHRTRGYKVTFAVFAAATYLTQFLYIIAHVPLVQIAPGVSANFIGVAEFVRNATIFIFPALLPVSTMLYTFSHGKDIARATAKPVQKWDVQKDASALQPATALLATSNALVIIDIPCDQCEWIGTGYKSQDSANRALRAHKQHNHKEV